MNDVQYLVRFNPVEGDSEGYWYNQLSDAEYHASLFGPADADLYSSIEILCVNFSNHSEELIRRIQLA